MGLFGNVAQNIDGRGEIENHPAQPNIVMEFCELLGGMVWVEGELGEVAEFKVVFPA